MTEGEFVVVGREPPGRFCCHASTNPAARNCPWVVSAGLIAATLKSPTNTSGSVVFPAAAMIAGFRHTPDPPRAHDFKLIATRTGNSAVIRVIGKWEEPQGPHAFPKESLARPCCFGTN